MRSLMLRDAMDRLFDSALTATPAAGWARGLSHDTASVPVNVFETEDAFHVSALIPGANPDAIEITAQPGGYLTIAAEIKPCVPETAKALWSEYGQFRFRRDVALPVVFDADKATVDYAHGVLELKLPKAPEARARQIKVRAST